MTGVFLFLGRSPPSMAKPSIAFMPAKVKETQNNAKQGHEFAIMELGKQSKVNEQCANQI